MGLLFNRARMTVSGAAGTGTVSLLAATSAAFFTFAEAGVPNGAVVSYVIEDGTDVELGVGTYTTAGTTLARTTVTASKIAGVAGTTKLNLTADAIVYIDALAGDIVHPPASSTDNAIARFDGTSGLAIQDYTSNAPTIDDTGNATFNNPVTINRDSFDGLTLAGNSANAISARFQNTVGSGRKWNVGSSGGGPTTVGNFFVYDDTTGAVRMSIDSSGEVFIYDATLGADVTDGALNVAGSIGSNSAYQNGAGFTMGAPAKAAGGGGSFSIRSNQTADGANYLSGSTTMYCDATSNLRRLGIACIEVSLAWRNVTINEAGTGFFGVGLNLPLRKTHFVQDNSSSSAINYTTRISSYTAGTPSAGIGVGLEFDVETASTNYEVGATLECKCLDVSSTAERFVLDAKQMVAGTLQDAYGVNYFMKSLSADAAYTNGTGAQNWFSSNGGVALEASTTYEFEGVLMLTNGTTTHTTSMLFGGTATLTSIGYMFECASVAVAAVGVAPTVGFAAVATAIIMNATSVAAGTVVKVRGLVRVNAAGTLIPQFQFNAAPGAGNVLKNSFFKLRKYGIGTTVNQGSWA